MIMSVSAGADSALGYKVQSPIILIMFNRPKQTREVLHQISLARPSQLLVVSDGPRIGVSGESELVQECRDLIRLIDWDCEVHTKFSNQNLGCRKSVSEGLTWAFSLVDTAIILEDDCLPAQSFFRFCDVLLERYRLDESVGSICGSNLDEEETHNLQFSYFKSSYPAVWGWATWKRVWDQYTADLTDFKVSSVREVVRSRQLPRLSHRFWTSRFEFVSKDKIDTWDYQLVFLHWRLGMDSLIARENLISNIGFGAEATHTLNPNSPYSQKRLSSLSFPLRHPNNYEASEYVNPHIGQNRFRVSLVALLIERLYLLLPPALSDFARKLLSSFHRINR